MSLTSSPSTEQQAIAIGNNKTALLKRLKVAIPVLNPYLVNRFKSFTYDFPNKRLVSKCGLFALIWQVRERPDLPESYGNQQTSKGTVHCRHLKPNINRPGDYTTV